MKKTLLFLFASAMLAGCGETAQNNAVINGTVTSQPDETWVYLSRYDGDMQRLDSVQLVDGAFTFEVENAYPERLFIQFEKQRNAVPFVIEPGTIQIEADFGEKPEFKASVTATNDFMIEFDNLTKRVKEQMNEVVSDFYATEDEEEREALSTKYEELEKEISEINSKFIEDHKNEIVAASLLGRESTYGFTVEKMDSLMSVLGSEMPKNAFLDKLNERREVLVKTAVGQPAPDFTLPQADGTPFTFSSLKGQVVLVDFWASWCGPCRRANPSVVALYNKYKDHGFTIVGVSLDDNREKWLEAVEKDGLDWVQVSELKRFNTQPAKDYGVEAIPHTTLVDQNGIIIGNVLHGDELEELVAKTLGVEVVK